MNALPQLISSLWPVHARPLKPLFRGKPEETPSPAQGSDANNLKPLEADILCHCLKVKESVVIDSICQQGASTVQEVRQKTEAGTGCTACIAKIKALLAKVKPS